MKVLHGIIGLGLAATTLSGCITRGRDFSSDINWIKPTQTTQGEVSQLLGAPYKVGSAGGVTTWTYSYYKLHLFGEDYMKDLKFYWSDDKRVKDFSFSSSFPVDRRQALFLNKQGGGASRTATAPSNFED